MRQKWLPKSDKDEDLGIALYLENDFWENMRDVVASGIAKALNG